MSGVDSSIEIYGNLRIPKARFPPQEKPPAFRGLFTDHHPKGKGRRFEASLNVGGGVGIEGVS